MALKYANQMQNLEDLKKEYCDFLAASSAGPCEEFHRKARRILLDDVEKLNPYAFPGISGQLLELRKLSLAMQSKSKEISEQYESLEFLFTVFENLPRLSKEIADELQFPVWDMTVTEIFFRRIHQGLILLSQQIQEFHKELSLEDCKVLAGKTLLYPDLCLNPIYAEFLDRHREYTLLHELNPGEFNRRLHDHIRSLETVQGYMGDTDTYSSIIDDIFLMGKNISREDRDFLQSVVEKLLKDPALPMDIFQKLLLFMPSEKLSQMAVLLSLQWKNDFLRALETGNIELVQRCLWRFAHLQFRNLTGVELGSSAEVSTYLNLLDGMPPQDYFLTGLCRIIEYHFQQRFSIFKRQVKSPSSLFFEMVESLEEVQEYGGGLRRLHLLEQLLLQNRQGENGIELQVLCALEKNDMSALQEIIEKSGLDPLAPHFNIIELIAELALYAQKEFQEDSRSSFNYKHRRQIDKSLFFFHKLVQKRLAEIYPKCFWKKVIEVFEFTASRANSVYVTKSGRCIFGKWDDPLKIYGKLIKIYIPEEEHGLWIKYCPEIADKSAPAWIETWRRASYLGTQKIYGRWFHLSGKAASESLLLGEEWPSILTLLGHCRKMIALFIANIQIPRKRTISVAAQLKIASIDKEWPGSPLNFGAPYTDFDEIFTTLTLGTRLHYVKKIGMFIYEFKKTFDSELMTVLKSKSLFKRGKLFTFRGRNITVYPLPVKNDFACVIACPFTVDRKSVVGTHILWNWPSDVTFFSPGCNPVRIHRIHKGMWIHASGRHKELIDHEVGILFEALTKPGLDQHSLEHKLGRFLYLFLQSLPFIRGTSAVGMILLNMILKLHGYYPPNAPGGMRFLDCEAMCTTEEEFIKGFLRWLRGDGFFS